MANILRKYCAALIPNQVPHIKNVMVALVSWEAGVKELERTEGNRVDEMAKLAALTELCPHEVRDLIFQHSEDGISFEGIRDKVIGWVSNKTSEPKVAKDIGAVEGTPDWGEEDPRSIYALGKSFFPKGKAKGSPKGGPKGAPFFPKGGKGDGKGGEKRESRCSRQMFPNAKPTWYVRLPRYLLQLRPGGTQDKRVYRSPHVQRRGMCTFHHR